VTFKRLAGRIALLAVFTKAARVFADTDTWWHLGAGCRMVENRRILTTVPFSLTRLGQAWTSLSWLAQLLLNAIPRLAGLPGLNILTALMVTLVFACTWPLMDGPGLLRSFGLLGAAAVLLVSAACVSLNPCGPRLLAHPVQTLGIGTLQTSIDEWQSLDSHRPDTLPFLATLVVKMFLIAVSPRRKTGREIL
jgi:hypothetical protein